MRSRTATWFETKIKYDKMMDNGILKPITESYVVDALSFTETETQIIDEMSVYISGEYSVVEIKPAKFKEVFFSDMEKDDRWYKAKLQFITLDEKTEKERRQTVLYLVQAGTLQSAVKYVDEMMGKTMIDYVIASMTETKIMDVFEHRAPKSEEKNDKPEYEQ